MQHGFTNDILALAEARGGGETVDLESRYHLADNLRTTFKSQAIHQYDMPKYFSLSPSTASDNSDHTDHSTTSETSSQTEFSDYENSSPTADLRAKESRYAEFAGHEDSQPTQPVVSRAAGVQPTNSAKSGCHGYKVSAIKPERDSGNDKYNANKNKSAVTIINGNAIGRHSSGLPQSSGFGRTSSVESNSTLSRQTEVANTQDQIQNEAGRLPYRFRPDHASEPCKTNTCIEKTLEVSQRQVKQEQSLSFDVKPPLRDASTQANKPRCYPGSFNSCTGFTSSQSTPVDSPQNLQANTRRRPVNSALPPPKLRRDTDNTDAIVRMIVIFCTNLIQSIWPADNTSGYTTCNATTQPGGNVLPLQVFITETLRRSKTSYSTLQIALFYLILLKQSLPELANPGQTGQSGCRAMLCGRRMFLTALILASKYLQDRNYSARAWSKISGLPMKEINDNERRYLRFVGWDLHVPKEAFENWSKIVLAICRLSTGQDSSGQDSQHPPPPSPGMGPLSLTTRKGQLQDMCAESQIHAVRAWWVFNLQALRTDVVRCPRRTEQYVLSIPHLKGTPTLARSPIESKSTEHTLEDMIEQEVSSPVHKLSRPPSMDFAEKASQHNISSYAPGASSKIMPPPPPVLGNLPTPQTTPRSDLADTWKSSQSRSGSRCRDSASLLRSLDRNCAMANLDKFSASSKCSLPPPMLIHSRTRAQECKPLSQSSPGVWLQQLHRARESFRTPDGSLTSSPESTVSDLSSLSGFVGRSRTSSFSSTSSRSTMSLLNTMTSDPEQCEGFKRQLNSLDAQIAPRVQHWRNTNTRKEAEFCTLQGGISRPQTAFRTSNLRPDCVEESVDLSSVDSESVFDEGYWSSDYAREKREEKKKQTAAQALLDMQARLECEQSTPTTGDVENVKPRFVRPNMTRSSTQVYAPLKQSTVSNQQTLKRSRSESFDTSVESSVPEPNLCNLSYAQARNVQQSCQPWADSKQPVFSGTQDANKRIAVQSAAATRASMDLKKNAPIWFDTNTPAGSAMQRKIEDVFVKAPTWQPCASQLRQTHVPSAPSNVCLPRWH